MISQLINSLSLRQGWISQTSLTMTTTDRQTADRQTTTDGYFCRGLPFGDGLIKAIIHFLLDAVIYQARTRAQALKKVEKDRQPRSPMNVVTFDTRLPNLLGIHQKY